jgi:hypothetical protein
MRPPKMRTQGSECSDTARPTAGVLRGSGPLSSPGPPPMSTLLLGEGLWGFCVSAKVGARERAGALCPDPRSFTAAVVSARSTGDPEGSVGRSDSLRGPGGYPRYALPVRVPNGRAYLRWAPRGVVHHPYGARIPLGGIEGEPPHLSPLDAQDRLVAVAQLVELAGELGANVGARQGEGVFAKAMNFPPELWFEEVENLPDVSGARPSWFVDDEGNLAILDDELVEALRDETVRAILREVVRLPERERRVVLGIVRQFGGRAG